MKTLYKQHPEALARFNSCQEYQRYLRRTGDILDNVQIGNILYTMDEYDLGGKYITYGNKRTGYALRLDTSNRYSESKCSDAKVYKWKSDCFRNGINYID